MEATTGVSSPALSRGGGSLSRKTWYGLIALVLVAVLATALSLIAGGAPSKAGIDRSKTGSTGSKEGVSVIDTRPRVECQTGADSRQVCHRM